MYRYSTEYDRGTPTTGIYAHDGLWDEDVRPDVRPSAIATTFNRRETQASGSLKGRSRSGTVSTVAAKEEKSGGMWAWGKKSHGTMTVDVEHSPNPAEEVRKEGDGKPALKKEKSRGRLRGKGRRGELSVATAGDADESVSKMFELSVVSLPKLCMC